MNDYMPLPSRYFTMLVIEALPGLTFKGLTDVLKVDPNELAQELKAMRYADCINMSFDNVELRPTGERLLAEYREADQIPTITDYLLKTLLRAFDAESERDSYKTDYHMTRRQALQAKTALNQIKAYIKQAEQLGSYEDNE